MKEEEGLKDESELQSYMIARIEKYLNDKGREIIGWDEILDERPGPQRSRHVVAGYGRWHCRRPHGALRYHDTGEPLLSGPLPG